MCSFCDNLFLKQHLWLHGHSGQQLPSLSLTRNRNRATPTEFKSQEDDTGDWENGLEVFFEISGEASHILRNSELNIRNANSTTFQKGFLPNASAQHPTQILPSPSNLSLSPESLNSLLYSDASHSACYPSSLVMRHFALMLRVLKPLVLSFCSMQQSGERQLLLQKHSGDSPGFSSFPPSLFLFWLLLLTETGAIFLFCLHNSPWKNPTCLGQYTLKKLVLTTMSDCTSSRKHLGEKLYLCPQLLGLLRLALLPLLCPFDSGFKTKKDERCF